MSIRQDRKVYIELSENSVWTSDHEVQNDHKDISNNAPLRLQGESNE